MRVAIGLLNGRILDPQAGRDETGDLWVVGGRFVPAPPRTGTICRIDLKGRWLLPGLWDLHVHFREPGGERSETLATGALAAARGGFTRVVTMPNTTPPMDRPEWIHWQARTSVRLPVQILPAACCTVGRAGQAPAEFDALRAAGAVAFTDDGSMVSDDRVMEGVMRAVARMGGMVMDHAVVPALAAGGVIRDGPLARRLGLPVFPDEAEVEAVRRDIDLARVTGCRVHLQHLSCAAAVELLRQARAEGLPVTGEVTPHHLLLAVEDLTEDDPDWKMNPPLGSRADVEGLRRGVLDGTIQCLATDHAPHHQRLKTGGFRQAAFGVTGLETAVGATLQALVLEAGCSPLSWARAWTTQPAAVLGLPGPSLADGERADLCVVDPTPWRAGEDGWASKSANSPFAGRRLAGRTVLTMREGRVTWASAGFLPEAHRLPAWTGAIHR